MEVLADEIQERIRPLCPVGWSSAAPGTPVELLDWPSFRGGSLHARMRKLGRCGTKNMMTNLAVSTTSDLDGAGRSWGGGGGGVFVFVGAARVDSGLAQRHS